MALDNSSLEACAVVPAIESPAPVDNHPPVISLADAMKQVEGNNTGSPEALRAILVDKCRATADFLSRVIIEETEFIQES